MAPRETFIWMEEGTEYWPFFPIIGREPIHCKCFQGTDISKLPQLRIKHWRRQSIDIQFTTNQFCSCWIVLWTSVCAMICPRSYWMSQRKLKRTYASLKPRWHGNEIAPLRNGNTLKKLQSSEQTEYRKSSIKPPGGLFNFGNSREGAY